MLRSLLRVITLLLLSLVLVARFGMTELLASEISSTYLVELANQDRQIAGASPLKYNKKLERAAFQRAENMFKEQYWAHYGPHKESPWQFILGAGYTYAYAGENLAKGYSDSQSVHDAWMASPTHRANILDAQFQEVGIAVVKGRLLGADIFLVVQMFGSPTYQPNNSDEARPSIKITAPKDGDILEDGITDIRGQATNLDNPAITVYLNSKLIGSTQLANGQFSLVSPLIETQGEQTIIAKAVGLDEAYLSDSIQVTVVNKKTEILGVSRECIVGKRELVSLVVTYTCARENNGLSVTVGSMRYRHDADVRQVMIPLASLPREDATTVVAIQFADGASSSFTAALSELGRDSSSAQTEGTTNILSTLKNLELRSWVFGIFGLSFLLLLLYAGELVYTRQLLTHRYELLSMTLFLGILLITFNFGFVRV